MTQANRTSDHSLGISPSNRPIHGVWSPVLVPVQEDFSIDVDRFLAHARWLLDQGCHGIALFGTTSEANSFSLEERMGLLESALEAGVDPRQIMVGTGCCALPDSVRLTRHAVDNGCHKVLMLPPFYYKGVSDAGLYRSYAEVIDRVDDDALRVLFYHFPKLSGVPITPGLIELLLTDYPGIIAGLKDSSGDWSNTADLIERFPDMSIFPGSECFLLQGLTHGGAGCITATANVNAASARAVWDAWSENSAELDTRNEHLLAARTVIEAYPVIPAQKYLLAHHRKDPQWRRVRPPLLDLDDTQGTELSKALTKIDFNLSIGDTPQ